MLVQLDKKRRGRTSQGLCSQHVGRTRGRQDCEKGLDIHHKDLRIEHVLAMDEEEGDTLRVLDRCGRRELSELAGGSPEGDTGDKENEELARHMQNMQEMKGRNAKNERGARTEGKGKTKIISRKKENKRAHEAQ